MTMLTGADEPGGGGDRSVTKLDCLASQVSLDKPARLIIRLLVGFVSDSVFVKLNQNKTKLDCLSSQVSSIFVCVRSLRCLNKQKM